MDKHALAAIRDVPIIQGFMPYMEQELKALALEVDNKAYLAMSNGTLTPDMAMNFWAERNAYKKILQRFQARIKVGQSMGAANQKALDRA